MKSKSTNKSKKTASTKKADNLVLATCPVNGAGWCPYPFSVAQLKRRLKAKELEAKLELESNSGAKMGTNSAQEKPVTQSKSRSRSKSA